jgi:hypothetical protein
VLAFGGALGVAFKRQVLFGDRYVADFYAPSVGLVMEVDGGVHRGSRAADRRRDEWLRRRGYRVVRVNAAAQQCRSESRGHRPLRTNRLSSFMSGRPTVPSVLCMSGHRELLLDPSRRRSQLVPA